MFVGDDVTDEEAFALEGARPDRFVGVRVGRSRSSHARLYLRSQEEIDRLLEVLAALRERPRAPARATAG